MSRVLPSLGLLALLSCSVFAAEPEPTIYGRYEYIHLDELGKTLRAKMDTGAMTASLSARDIKRFERDGEKWVRFRLAMDGADDTLYEHRLVRVSRIKARNEEQDVDDEEEERSQNSAKRPVIEMQLCIGDHQRMIEVNLADRSHFRYPLLIGAQAIDKLDGAIDPSRKYTAGRPDC
ncbi:ATP-dependent zinc protease [Azomonas macrocytogenes]|uniref:Retropepsin-like aspartic endopeptidase domain-containing protein n=1 Tax=Azomonas macrocytogenes TaxID=69962 RepID=A0A839T458_AZOMA|nr:ATP-dependent zinc protease [Azomonas macrocytogenes]MBB3102725.1 hypothetical protein [Azomonas macrocytogenes]